MRVLCTCIVLGAAFCYSKSKEATVKTRLDMLSFRLPPDARKQIEAIAAREDRQPSYVVRRIVLAALDNQERNQAQRESAASG